MLAARESKGHGVKHWLERIIRRFRELARPDTTRYHTEIIIPGPPKAKSRHYIVTNTAGIRDWIVRHRVWIWAFVAIAGYFLYSQYLFNLIGDHYERHSTTSVNLRIDHLSFWDRDNEGARNLALVLGGWLAVLAAIVGFVFAGFRTSSQTQMAQTAIDGQVTERFTRAVEQLGHKKRAVRLGAIYALERIAADSPRDRDVIVETLAAYIRELAPWPPVNEISGRPLEDEVLESEIARTGVRPPIDIAAALTVICRLLPGDDPMRKNVDLRHTDLRGLDAPRINLSRMRLDGANLMNAKLWRSLLRVTSLLDSNLSGTSLLWSDLSWANLDRANLRGVNLFGATLDSTGLSNAEMSGADLKDVTGLFQDLLYNIRYHRDDPPKNLPAGLTLPEPYDG